jgi:hypothetical protein
LNNQNGKHFEWKYYSNGTRYFCVPPDSEMAAMFTRIIQVELSIKQLMNQTEIDQHNNAMPSADCINYNPSTRTITVSCSSARLIDIDNTLHDSNILSKQSPADGVWYLNTN